MIWILLAIVLIIGSLFTPRFLTQRNFINILEHASILGILVIGQSLCFLSGNFDLSAESALGFTGMLGAWLVTSAGSPAFGSGLELNPFLGILIMFGVGVLIGVINGFFVTRVKINNFVVTLAMLIILRGACFIISEGITVSRIPENLIALGHGSIGIFPISVIVLIVFFILAQLFTKYTQFGRNIYAVGGNRDAAIASGINADQIIRRVYIISGIMAAFAGWMYVGRIASANALMGQGVIFEVNSAAVIGGISLFGGRGNMIGALGGVMLLSAITSLLQLWGISAFWIDAVRGSLILLAMFIDNRKVYFQKTEFASVVTSIIKS